MRDQVNRLCQWPQLTQKLFALAAKKCFKLNNYLPQELELHFVLDLVLGPQVVLASQPVIFSTSSLVTNMLFFPSVNTTVVSEFNIWELIHSRESMNSVGLRRDLVTTTQVWEEIT